jgi:rfaE bifunctional protein kinase chain/domain
VISQNQQVVRVDQESTTDISKEIQRIVLKNFEDSITRSDAVILADYNKGLFSKPLINAITDISKSNKVPVYVDPKKNHFSDFKNSRLFKPNLKEFQQATGSGYKSKNFIKQGTDFRSRISAEIVLITLGSEGISLFTEDGHISIPTKARKVHDVSGAGDTVISTFVLADLCGANPVESATLGNLAAGRVCEEVGVVPITLSKLADIVQAH